MSRKKIFFCVLLLSMMMSFNASAQLKLDGLAGVERVLTSVQTAVESVMKKVNEAAKIFQGSLLGDSASTNWETFKALKSQIKDIVAAGQELYEEASSLGADAESIIKDSYEELKDEISSATPVSTATLQKEIDTLDSQMEDRKSVVAEELSAKIKAAQQNEEILTQLYESEEDEETKSNIGLQLAAEESIRAQLQADLDTLSEDGNVYLASDDQYQDLKSQRDTKSQELSEALENLKGKAKGLFIQGMIKKSPAEKAADYNKAQASNFASDDEELTQEVVNRINKERVTNLEKDMARTFVTLVDFRKKAAGSEEIESIEENVNKTTGNIASADKTITALRLQNQLKIIELDLLHDQILMESSYLRLKSSLDMLKQPYRLLNPDKDQTQMNLDNYVITKESIEAQTEGNREGD